MIYPRCQRGFSLLEVLVAFTILSVSLGVLLQIFSTGLRNAALTEDYSRAVVHAQSLLAGLGIETPLEEGVQEGEIDERFYWRVSVAPYQEEDPDLDLENLPVIAYQLRVEVFWRQRSVALESLRLAEIEEGNRPAQLQGLNNSLNNIRSAALETGNIR